MLFKNKGPLTLAQSSSHWCSVRVTTVLTSFGLGAVAGHKENKATQAVKLRVLGVPLYRTVFHKNLVFGVATEAECHSVSRACMPDVIFLHSGLQGFKKSLRLTFSQVV